MKDINWIDEYRMRYGERWILRELDFLPESLSNLARINPELYTPSIYRRCCTEAEKLGWKVYRNEKDALLASHKIRTTLGMPESIGLKCRLADIILNQ